MFLSRLRPLGMRCRRVNEQGDPGEFISYLGREREQRVTEDPVDAEVNASKRFSLLASAISGRPLEVAAGDPGMPAWTDGRTVFINAEAAHRTQVQCVVVQAALLCAGSFEPRFSPSWPASPRQLAATSASKDTAL